MMAGLGRGELEGLGEKDQGLGSGHPDPDSRAGGHIRVYYDTEALAECWGFALARVTLTLTAGWLGKLDMAFGIGS